MTAQQRGGFAVATMALSLVGSVRAVPLGEGNQTSSPADQASSESGGLSTIAVVVIVVGVVLVLALLGWIYVLTCRKKKKKSSSSNSKKTTADDLLSSAQTQQPSMEKSHEFHDEFSTHYVDIIDEHKAIHIPRSSGRPTGAPRPSRPAGEPALYNREISSTFGGNSDSTRSYLHDLAEPAKNGTNRTPKIYASMNSVDFAYPDTDRSIPFSVASDNNGNDYSSRSNDITDSYGFLMDSNRSSGLYEDDEGDAVPSLRPKERDVARDGAYDQDVDTAELTTQQRRQIQVEI